MARANTTKHSPLPGKEGSGVSAKATPTLGFGVPATSDPHHFKVIIPT